MLSMKLVLKIVYFIRGEHTDSFLPSRLLKKNPNNLIQLTIVDDTRKEGFKVVYHLCC